MIDVAIAFFIGLVIGGCGGVFALALCIMSGKNEPRDDQKERFISCEIEKGDKMKFNFIDYIEFEIDWKAVAAIAACVLGYAIITVVQKGGYTY